MKSQDHKSTTDDGRVKSKPGLKTNFQMTHPVLQLQQMVGNKAVANMIQRHGNFAMNRFGFKVVDNETGESETLFSPTAEGSGKPSKSASEMIDSASSRENDIYQD